MPNYTMFLMAGMLPWTFFNDSVSQGTSTIIGNSEMLYKPIEGEYCYVTTESLRIFGLDVDEAVDMEFMAPIDIKDGEMYVTRTFAETYGYEVGDKITIHDRARDEVELTIGGLLPDDN